MTSYESNAWDLIPNSELAEYSKAMDAQFKVREAYDPLVATIRMEKTKYGEAHKAKIDELKKLYAEWEKHMDWIIQFLHKHTLPEGILGPPLDAPESYVN